MTEKINGNRTPSDLSAVSDGSEIANVKQGIFTVLSQRRPAKDVYEMVLGGDTSAITRPGQFVNLKLDGFFLRRPISVCNVEGDRLTLIYKVVGGGTAEMAAYPVGRKIDVLTGLGNGYDVTKAGAHPLLIGGGVGVPPLYLLCRELCRLGAKPTVILGFNTAEEVFYEEEFSALSATVKVTTVDGSRGTKGFVTAAMEDTDYTYFYTCGPMPMFRAIEAVAKTSGQYSFEERMGCGFGACMGCTCKTKYGNKRICKDGPVLQREEIVW